MLDKHLEFGGCATAPTPQQTLEGFEDTSWGVLRKRTLLYLRLHPDPKAIRSSVMAPTLSCTHTSIGYMSAHDVTPAREPHAKGIMDGWMGSHVGGAPCSSVLVLRPSMLRIASYSMK